MFNSSLDFLLPIICVIALYLMRIREFFIKRDVVTGTIKSPATFSAMLMAGSSIVALSLVEYLVRDQRLFLPTFLPGLVIAISSFLLRGAAGKALGRMWSVHVEIREKHELVKSGPYRWIRHPIYTAAIMEVLGAILVMNAAYSTIAMVIVLFPVIAWRIRVEEKSMIEQFGVKYVDYIASTSALLPMRRPQA